MTSRGVASLVVLLDGAIAGQLDHVGNARMRFKYDDAAAAPLSLSLPVRAEPFEHDACEPWFGGLLPEGAVRELIERQERVSRRNDFALLSLIGGDCAGAVSLHPEGEIPAEALERWHEPDVLALDEAALEALVAELPRRPLRAGPDGPLRLSLAGAQDKVAVVIDDAAAREGEPQRIGLPLGVTPSTHLLKVGDPAFPGIVEVEEFCLALAAASGFESAAATVRMVADRPVLLVARYDRVRDERGRLRRLHQEDACQALGISSLVKYEAEGGPGLADLASMVRTHVRPPAPSLLDLVLRAGFHDLVGNADAHGKNWSVLLGNSVARLAPMYDIVSTLAWESLDTRYAMRIGGERRAMRIDLDKWRVQASAMGMSAAQLARALSDQASSMLVCLDAVLSDWKPTTTEGAVRVERVAEIVRTRSHARLFQR